MSNPNGTPGDTQRHRYTLTTAGLLATFPRGACGHILCVDRPCVYRPTAGAAS